MHADLSDIVTLFASRATDVNARVLDITGLEGAASHIAALVSHIPGATVAAPTKDDAWWHILEPALAHVGARVHRWNLREHTGFSIGVTRAEWGIAETGTVVMDARDEDVRIASMMAETHVVLLDRDRVRPDLGSLLPELRPLLAQAPGYMAFVTGPSRTADIESILALGAHGPRAVDILLVGGTHTGQ